MFTCVQTYALKNKSSTLWRIFSYMCFKSVFILFVSFIRFCGQDSEVFWSWNFWVDRICWTWSELSIPWASLNKIIFAVLSWSSLGPVSELALTLTTLFPIWLLAKIGHSLDKTKLLGFVLPTSGFCLISSVSLCRVWGLSAHAIQQFAWVFPLPLEM